MSARIMTPIREEEVQTTLSANASTTICKDEAAVNINVAANSTTPIDEEEVKTSSSASTIVPVREEEEEELDSGMIVVGYFFQVPSVKWHPKLEMMSKAGLSQGQYEQKVLAQGYVDDVACRPRHPQLIYHHNFTSSP